MLHDHDSVPFRWRLLGICLLALALWLVILGVRDALAQPVWPACTHYAASNGVGAACTAAAPCKIASWWPLAGPGKTLCLRDGTYTGGDSMIHPPAGLKGTQAQPIMIRAEHDGKVLINAQGSTFAVLIGWHGGAGSNDWFVVEGINATGGRESTYLVAGADTVLRRVIAFNGTHGQDDSDMIRMEGYRSRAEDCAGWGNNARKIMTGTQSGNLQGAGFRRCWAEWNDHPQGQSNPNNTYEIGYNSSNQLYENVIGTWDTKGQTAEVEGVLHVFGSNDPNKPHDMQGSKLLGSIAYAAPGQQVPAGAIVTAYGLTGMLMQDVAALVSPGHASVSTFWLGNYMCTGSKPCTNNICRNCLAVGPPPSIDVNSGWTMPGLRQGVTLDAATGGTSAFKLLPGLCKRYENGTLTNTPLWPWPMNQRIKEARVASGFASVDVTAMVESLLGPLPSECKSDGAPPEPSGALQADIRWADTTNTTHTGYQVHRQIRQTNGQMSGYMTLPGNITPESRSFVDSSPIRGTLNCYAVETLSNQGSSPRSSPDACAEVPAEGNPNPALPVPVTDVSVTITTTSPTAAPAIRVVPGERR